MDPSAKVIGFRYLDGFACIGAACEDACCSDWEVPVDRAHWEGLRVAMDGNEAERARFAAAVRELPEAERTPSRHALMVLREDRACAMLDEERLCHVQRHHGEALTPDTCAVYPRVVGRVGDRLEVTGYLSCPELARRALLDPTGAELVPLEPSAVVRGIVHKHASPLALDPYERSFAEVRSTVHNLLSQRWFPLASRLHFVAWLAEQTRGYFLRAAPQFDEPHLARQLAQIRRLEVQRALHEQLAAATVDDPFAMAVVIQLLSARLRTGTAAFRRLVEAALGSYRGAKERPFEVDPQGRVQLLADRLYTAYERRRGAVSEVMAARIDLYLENYCVNYWFKDWYLAAGSLLDHTFSLLLRVAALRFLLISQPAVAEAFSLDDAAAIASLDRMVVEVVYSFARAIEHDDSLLRRMVADLEEQGMQSPAHAVALLYV